MIFISFCYYDLLFILRFDNFVFGGIVGSVCWRFRKVLCSVFICDFL